MSNRVNEPTPTKMKRRQHSSSSSKPIPDDLIFDIFTKLPVKSLVRFRCVSKLCSSFITNPSFLNAHANHFPVKPLGLLITCPTRLQSGQKFFSVDYDGGSAFPLLTVPPRFSRYTTNSINGLILMDFGLCATICNPSTRQAFTLPFVCSVSPLSANSTYFCVNSFGFDPVSKEYKVLNSWALPGRECEYRVFKLGTTCWRRVNGGPPYYPYRESVCVDGIVFFRSWVSMNKHRGTVLVSFDLQSETFRVTQIPEEASERVNVSDLIVFAGRPAIAEHIHEDDECLVIWILDENLEDKWFKLTIFLPDNWKELREEQDYFVAGVVRTNEILLVPRKLSRHVYVISLDMVKHRMRRAEIFGLPDCQLSDLCSNTVCFTNYEENILSFP